MFSLNSLLAALLCQLSDFLLLFLVQFHSFFSPPIRPKSDREQAAEHYLNFTAISVNRRSHDLDASELNGNFASLQAQWDRACTVLIW